MLTIKHNRADSATQQAEPEFADPVGWRAPWADSEMSTIRILRSQGKTVGFIAKRLGRSKNAVCGKIDRMRKAGEI